MVETETKECSTCRRPKKFIQKKRMTATRMANKIWMVNIYVFRNILTNKVIITPFFRITPTLLKHYRLPKLRPDHLVPLLVLSGLKNVKTAIQLVSKVRSFKSNKILNKNIHNLDNFNSQQTSFGLAAKVRSPRANQHPPKANATEWTIPREIKEAVCQFCVVLGDVKEGNRWLRKELEEWDDGFANKAENVGEEKILGDAHENRKIENGNIIVDNDDVKLKVKKVAAPLTLHWERDDFRRCIDDDQLHWPEFVQHKPLELQRGRFPRVPHFDFKYLKDTYHRMEDAIPLKPRKKDKLVGWKPFNIPKMLNYKKPKNTEEIKI